MKSKAHKVGMGIFARATPKKGPITRVTPLSGLRVKGTEKLQRRIASVRAAKAGVDAMTGVVILIPVLIGLFALEMGTDWMVELSWPVRALVLTMIVGVTCYVAGRWIVRPLVRRPDDDQVALMIERGVPALRTRFIASVQLAREAALSKQAMSAMVRALVADTTAALSVMDFRRVIGKARLLRALKIGVPVTVAGLLLFFMIGEPGRILLRRAVLFNDPVPRMTRVTEATGDLVVAQGDNVSLAARAEGFVPSVGKVSLEHASGAKQDFVL